MRAEVQIIKDQLQVLIQQDSLEEVNKITGDVVKEAAGLMKSGKAEVSEGFNSYSEWTRYFV